MLEALMAAAPAALKLLELAVTAAIGKPVDPLAVKSALDDLNSATARVLDAVEKHIEQTDAQRRKELDELPST